MKSQIHGNCKDIFSLMYHGNDLHLQWDEHMLQSSGVLTCFQSAEDITSHLYLTTKKLWG